MEALITSLEGPKGGKSKDNGAPQEVVSNMQKRIFLLDNKFMLQFFVCVHTLCCQSGVLAVHMRTVNLIDPESKWYTSCHKSDSISPWH